MDQALKYDSKADILSVKLREGATSDEKIYDSDVLVGLDKNGEVVAIEVWDASKKGLIKTLVDLAKEKRELVDTLLDRHMTNDA